MPSFNIPCHLFTPKKRIYFHKTTTPSGGNANQQLAQLAQLQQLIATQQGSAEQQVALQLLLQQQAAQLMIAQQVGISILERINFL